MDLAHLLCRCFLLAICLHTVSALSCNPEERKALLDFRNSFNVQHSESSCYDLWNLTRDCCSWGGIECDQNTGHITDVNIPCLRGAIPQNGTIFNFPFLKTLRLGGNFLSSTIPEAIGKLTQLVELEISSGSLSGEIPSGICNLSNLRSLLLFDNKLTGKLPSCIFRLPSLKEIRLWENCLEGPLPGYNVTNLVTLLLQNNLIGGNVPSWLFSLSSLESFDLSFNNLIGPIELFRIPASSVLKSVILSHNRISGVLPSSLFQLVNVTQLDLSANLLSGELEWKILTTMRKLEVLSVSENRGLSFKNSDGSVINIPPMLNSVSMSFCNLTEFPSFLQAADNLRLLDVSNNMIRGQILQKNSGGWKQLKIFYADHNLITGFDEYPQTVETFSMSFNLLQIHPQALPNSMMYLLLDNNRLSGEISSGFCGAFLATIIDLSFNKLSGVLPSCIMNSSSLLKVINLQGNSFYGAIPYVSPMVPLEYAILSDNRFEGNLKSFKDCKDLRVLDVGNNNIRDTYPDWLEDHTALQILILRFNNFYGEISIPKVESPFPSLQILDFSFNNFTGVIPRAFVSNLGFFKNLNSNSTIYEYIGYDIDIVNALPGRVKVILKSSIFKEDHIFPNMTIIDLSNNHFVGSIPATFGELEYLRVLNLAGNAFYCHIPISLGNITRLTSLDLSRNIIGGQIPQALMDLNYLSFFNVSFNNLAGQIPRGKRWGLFPSSSYIGNPGLCGLPLSTVC